MVGQRMDMTLAILSKELSSKNQFPIKCTLGLLAEFLA